MPDRVGFEPATIGLKDSHLIYQALINQLITVFAYLHCGSKSRQPVAWRRPY